MKGSWLSVAMLPAMSDGVYHRLRGAFGDAEAALAAGTVDVARAARLTRERAATLLSREAGAAAAEAIAASRAAGHALVEPDDDAYPRLLREIFEPPRFLAVAGALDDPPGDRIAIVGSRDTEHRARDAARALARALAERGYCIVSGLARGVDTAAHEGALDAGGPTIAVLGTGLDVVYPSENADLAKRIGLSGALVSPFAPGTPPLRLNFPLRNKTIAGLSRAVIVVQAPERSGALLTARLALHANREVLAMPGPVGEARYAGSNRLLREGACVCLDAGDVIGELEGAASALAYWNQGAAARSGSPLPALTVEEKRLLGALTGEPVHVDQISSATDLAPAALLPLLLNLEIKGAVRSLPGAHYARRIALGPAATASG